MHARSCAWCTVCMRMCMLAQYARTTRTHTKAPALTCAGDAIAGHGRAGVYVCADMRAIAKGRRSHAPSNPPMLHGHAHTLRRVCVPARAHGARYASERVCMLTQCVRTPTHTQGTHTHEWRRRECGPRQSSEAAEASYQRHPDAGNAAESHAPEATSSERGARSRQRPLQWPQKGAQGGSAELRGGKVGHRHRAVRRGCL